MATSFTETCIKENLSTHLNFSKCVAAITTRFLTLNRPIDNERFMRTFQQFHNLRYDSSLITSYKQKREETSPYNDYIRLPTFFSLFSTLFLTRLVS